MDPVNWSAFEATIQTFFEANHLQEIILHRIVGGVSRWGEEGTTITKDIVLKGVIDYNYYTHSTINSRQREGVLDKQHCSLYIHREALKEVGLLNSKNEIDINQGTDLFDLNGVVYSSMGVTGVSQTNSKPIIFVIILERYRKESQQHVPIG